MIYKDIKLNRKQFYVYLEYPFVTTDLNAYRITTAEKNAASIAVTAKRADGSTLSCIDTAKNGCVLPQDVYAVEGELKLFISVSDENGSIVTENQVIAYVKKGFDSQQSAGNQNTSSLAVTAYNTANEAIAAAEAAADLAKKSAESVANKAEKDHTHTDYDTATLQAMYNEVIEPSPERWFTFDSETQSITGLNEEYTEEYSATDVTKLIVPYSIGGVIVKGIGYNAFANVDTMIGIIPSNIIHIRLPNCIEYIDNCAFHENLIKSINIPTSCCRIGDYAFEGNSNLCEVITPIKPNWELSIGWWAFASCTKLTNIDTIIDGVKHISTEAFRYANVENVVVPESVASVDNGAFLFSNLRYITFLNKDCIIADNIVSFEDSSLELIKGYKGSTAETYAKNNGIPFMSIEGTEVLDKADKADIPTKVSQLENDKNFELIATQTVSPDTDGNLPNAIEFVLDEGLTDFYLLATTKITASSPLRLAINDISMWGNGTVSGLNSTTNTSMFYWNIQYLSFGEDKGGVISAPKQSSTIRSPQGNYYDDYSVYVPPTDILDKKANIDNITKIKLSLLTSGVTFVNGSTFELWGVKKT